MSEFKTYTTIWKEYLSSKTEKKEFASLKEARQHLSLLLEESNYYSHANIARIRVNTWETLDE